jgi:hypothetical protein
MAAKIYKTKAGKRVPSVTTILKNVGDSEGLIRWANRIGLEGIDLQDARKKAQDVGTLAHAMIEADLKGEKLDTSRVDPELLGPAETSFAAWSKWRALHQLKPVAVEQPLVSEEFQFGGTMDVVFDLDCRTMEDHKTGGIYPEHLVQIAGYGILWNEHHPDEPIEQYQLLSVHKESGAIKWMSWAAEQFQPAIDTFLTARELYGHHSLVRKLL